MKEEQHCNAYRAGAVDHVYSVVGVYVETLEKGLGRPIVYAVSV